MPHVHNPPPLPPQLQQIQPFIDQVRACEPAPNELRVPVCIDDGYGNMVGTDGYSLPVRIVGGDITIENADINSDLNDGYGNPIGSIAGSLNVNVTGGSITILTDPESDTHDGYGNPIGSVAGALNVNVVNEPAESPDSYTNDGYGNPIGSVTGALNVYITNPSLPDAEGYGNFYSDRSIQNISASPSFTSFVFGFISAGIIVANDDGGIGGKNLEFSFNNFTNIHGVVPKGGQVTMDTLRRTGIQLRASGNAPTSREYRLIVWG